MKIKVFHLLFLFTLCIGCSNYTREKTISLENEIAKTSIHTAKFDSLLQSISQLPSKQRIECILNISYRKENTDGILKQEKLLTEILPIASYKKQKEILLRLVFIYSLQDQKQVTGSRIKGLKCINHLYDEYTLTQDEKWYLSPIKASFLNRLGKQKEYLNIWFNILKEHRASNKTQLIAEDLYAIASYIMNLGDIEKAISFYREAYLISKKEKHIERTNKYLLSLSLLLSENKQYKEALVHFNKMDSTISFNSPIYNALVDCYIGINKPDSARFILTKKLVPQSPNKILFNNQLAETYILDENEDSAAIYLKKALVAYESIAKRFEGKENKVSLPFNFIHTYSKYAELLQKNGKTNQAAEAYQLIEPLMDTNVQSLNWKEKQIDAITSYSTFCRKNNQYEKALNLLIHRDSLQLIYNRMKEKQEHTNLVNRFEIEDLTHRIELQDKELEYSKTLNIILICGGVLGSILLTMLFLLFRSRKAQFLKLYQQQEQLQKIEENHVEQPEVPSATKALYLNAEKKVRTDKLFLKNDLSIEYLSEVLNTNRTYLSSSINEFTGKSYSIWINDFRIKYAIKLMHNDTTISIKNLALQCGYSSNETFYKNFKQRCGVTPSQYLNQIIIEQSKTGTKS